MSKEDRADSKLKLYESNPRHPDLRCRYQMTKLAIDLLIISRPGAIGERPADVREEVSVILDNVLAGDYNLPEHVLEDIYGTTAWPSESLPYKR